MYKKILIAYDGSKAARFALSEAAQIGKLLNAALFALWVHDSLPHFSETIDEVQEEKEASGMYEQQLAGTVREIVKKENIKIDFVTLPGNPAKVIVEYAKNLHADLIVMGHTGHHNLWGNLLGNTADKISDHAPCDVLIVRNKVDKPN